MVTNKNISKRWTEWKTHFGPQSEKLKKDILLLLSKYLSTNSFNIILVNNIKIGSFFHYKDKLPSMSRSRFVYNYKCSQCDAQYLGSTQRNLHVRVNWNMLGLVFVLVARLTSPISQQSETMLSARVAGAFLPIILPS